MYHSKNLTPVSGSPTTIVNNEAERGKERNLVIIEDKIINNRINGQVSSIALH